MARLLCLLLFASLASTVGDGCAEARAQAGTPAESVTPGAPASGEARPERGYTGLDLSFAASVTSAGVLTRAYPVVRAVHPDSPAQQAGFLPGDLVLEVDGQDSREDGVTWFGPAVRYVIRLRRGEEEREVVLVPDPPRSGRTNP